MEGRFIQMDQGTLQQLDDYVDKRYNHACFKQHLWNIIGGTKHKFCAYCGDVLE